MAPRPPTPVRRLLHRIPVRVRHYWKLLAGCVAFVAVLGLVFSTVRVHPYVTSAGEDTGNDVTQDIAGRQNLFDTTVAHDLKLTFRDADYQRQLDSYFDEGEKDYLEADLTIDGTLVPSVGIRLKGNSTLQGLTRNGQARPRAVTRPGGAAAGGAFPGGGAPGGAAPGGAFPGGAAPGGAAPGGGGPGGGFGGGFGRAGLAAEKPETLPWLIRFDEFVDGRRYQGHRELAVRVAGMGGGSTVLNEALALDLLASAGEPAQRYAYAGFTVNNRPTTARLIVEHPDENFADQFDDPGVLYKALSTSRFTDQGDDPVDYQDDFKQINLKGSQDTQPVIDLVKWVTGSTDADFDAHLADHVDVPSFARYVAEQNLLLNFDDMAGPGHNYYLRYDLTTKKFSVIGWDYNLTFSGNAEQKPHEQGSMGGGGRRGGGDFQPPAGFDPPAGGGRAGGMMQGHALKDRFLASKAYTKVYEDAYRDLYQKMFASGDALSALTRITTVLGTVTGADPTTIATDTDTLRTLVQQRTASLAKDEVITKG